MVSDDGLTKRELRHNLKALWEMAGSRGLKVSATPPEWAGCLSGLHNHPYYLRYSTGVHGLVLPPPEPMATELEALAILVEAALK